MPPGTGTWVDVTTAAPQTVFTLHMVDASNDTFTERLVVAVSTTLAAVQAWVALYQLVTQASVYGVTRESQWFGDKDPDNAEAGYRGSVSDGVNLLFKDPDTRDTRPLRAVAPVSDIMQGNQDIPLLSSDPLSDLILATIAIQPLYLFQDAQFTGRRERRNNPRVG